jgi:hypothetical protein
MSMRAAVRAAAGCLGGLVLGLGLGASAGATSYPVLLFGGPEHEDFLGCLTCDASEPYSIWNPNSEYGSPGHPLSIWNREGRYGSQDSPHSPWSRRPESVPLVVDRAGNLCGNFAVDRTFPGRVTDGFLIWILEGHDWIADHLDEVREDFRSGTAITPCGLPPDHAAEGSGG